jgi:hypothetical protein
MVLVLSTLHQLLAQLLVLPELHTAILLTPEGQLISVASDISRSKDQARIVAGVSGEVWQETQEQGHGMVESEVCSRKFGDQQTVTHVGRIAWSYTCIACHERSRS